LVRLLDNDVRSIIPPSSGKSNSEFNGEMGFEEDELSKRLLVHSDATMVNQSV
jgi:hypothetical protein